jgi:hypothetical protein
MENRFVVSHLTLKILAALVWIGGGLALVRKAIELLLEAAHLRPGSLGPWVAAATGMLVGSVLALVLFRRSCRKNLTRIASLKAPKIWQFYRPGFFLALTFMIAAGATLSHLAHEHYSFLLAVAALDLHIGTALLGSSSTYWQERASAVMQ